MKPSISIFERGQSVDVAITKGGEEWKVNQLHDENKANNLLKIDAIFDGSKARN